MVVVRASERGRGVVVMWWVLSHRVAGLAYSQIPRLSGILLGLIQE
jgi:hypothetical protein